MSDGLIGIQRTLAFRLKFSAALLLYVTALSLLPPHRLNEWLTIFFAAPIWFCLIRWLLRSRRLGPLLLDASRPLPWFLKIMLPSAVGLYLWAMILEWQANRSIDPNRAVFLILMASIFLVTFLSRRVEIRQKGLAFGGMWLPWSKIVSYAWDPDSGEFDILRVPTSGLWGWFPTRILVKKELRSQFDAALTRQLMEWPRRTG